MNERAENLKQAFAKDRRITRSGRRFFCGCRSGFASAKQEHRTSRRKEALTIFDRGTFPADINQLYCKSLIAFLAGTVALSPGLFTYAASPDFLWARPATNRIDIGHAGGSVARSVASDCLSNVFVAGTFTSTVIRFGAAALTNTTSGQGNFLCKYDSSGSLLWARLAGTNSGSRPLTVAVDASTNVWVAGYISGTAMFGTNSLVTSGPLAVFLAKYDPAVINPLGLSVASDGSAFIAGRCNGTANFGAVSLTNTSALLAKYGNDGGLIFAQAALAANAIVATVNGSVYLTGPGLLAKYGPLGDLVWSRSFPNGSAIALDALENVYSTGYGAGTYDGLALTNSGGHADFFLAKCNSEGSLQWLRQIGGTQQERGTGVAPDRYGNIFVTGISATASPEPSLVFGSTTLTNSLWFVAKYDASGNPQWARSSSPSVRASAFGLALSSPDAVHVAGSFYNTTSFGGLTLSEADTWGAGAAYAAKLATAQSPMIPVLGPTAADGNSHIQFVVTGAPGFMYTVEASTSLTQWTPLFTNNSPFVFVDFASTNFPVRFYRARLAP
jgi:hypothetical protein